MRTHTGVISGVVTSAGAITNMNGGTFTVVKTGTGTYVIYPQPGFRIRTAHATSAGGGTTVSLGAATDRSQAISTFLSTTGAAADLPWTFTLFGQQT